MKHALIAARWIVWGIHCIHAWLAWNSIPISQQRVSMPCIMVSLLLALSIITAIIWQVNARINIMLHVQTLFWILYSSNVDHTMSAIFSPECSPTNSQKSIRSSSRKQVDRSDTEIYSYHNIHCLSHSGQQLLRKHNNYLKSMRQVRG